MRLFIACEISDEAKKVLLELQAKLKFARFAKAGSDAMHITLKFLGEVNEKKIDKIKERLSKVSFKPFRLRLSEVGVFPNEQNVRVIWVGLKPAGPVIELQQKIEKSLLGLFTKDKNFYPHLTICRVKFAENKKALKGLIENLKIGDITIGDITDAKSVEFEINSFRLMKSELTPKGPKHEVLEEFGPKRGGAKFSDTFKYSL